jgi:hypothetical protein
LGVIPSANMTVTPAKISAAEFGSRQVRCGATRYFSQSAANPGELDQRTPLSCFEGQRESIQKTVIPAAPG